MGMFMGIDDMYIGGLLEVLNLHFGTFPNIDDKGEDKLEPDESTMELNVTGIREIRAIQAEFQIFRTDKALVKSLRALGVGGHWNAFVKRKWFKLLNRLDKKPSSDPALTGGKAIVAALIDHLKVQDPDPVHFKAHDLRTEPRVLIIKNDRPVFYIDRTFLTISIPMEPRAAQAPAPTGAPGAPPAPTPAPNP